MRTALWASVAAVAAGCGHDASLASRVAALEQRADAAAAEQQRLAEVLREHGIVFHAGPPRDAAEARARTLDDLDTALARVQSARDRYESEVLGSSLAKSSAYNAWVAEGRRALRAGLSIRPMLVRR